MRSLRHNITSRTLSGSVSRSTSVTKVRSPQSFAMSAALSAASTTRTRSALGAEAVTASAAPRTLAMNALA